MFYWPNKSEERDGYPEQPMREMSCRTYQTDEVAYINGENIKLCHKFCMPYILYHVHVDSMQSFAYIIWA